MKNYLKILKVACLISVISACSTIPITNLPKLAALSPQTFDFSKAKIAVRIEEGFRVDDGDVKLVANLYNGRTQENISETFDMVVTSKPVSPFLHGQMRSGFDVYGLSFAEKDNDRVLAFRDAFSNIVEQDRNANDKVSSQQEKNSFSLSVTTQGCLEVGSNPFQKMAVKIYLKPSEEKDYFTFVKEQKIDLAALNNGKMPSCGD